MMDANLIKKNLVTQITSQVLWVNSMEKFIANGYNLFVEVGPKSVLAGLMRDICRKVRIFNVENTKTLKIFIESINHT